MTKHHLKGQYHERSSKFSTNYAKIIKGALTDQQNNLKRTKKDTIKSIFKGSIIFSGFRPSNIVKLERSARRFQVLDHFFPTCP